MAFMSAAVIRLSSIFVNVQHSLPKRRIGLKMVLCVICLAFLSTCLSFNSLYIHPTCWLYLLIFSSIFLFSLMLLPGIRRMSLTYICKPCSIIISKIYEPGLLHVSFNNIKGNACSSASRVTPVCKCYVPSIFNCG